jgi:hypothetical protein
VIGFDQSPRYAELIRRVFGEDSELLPPGIFLELDRPEWKLFKRENLWTTGRITIAASPANLGRVQVFNPQASPGRIVVVTHVKIRPVLASISTITIDGPPASTPSQNIALDTRIPTVVGPGAPLVSSQNLIGNNNAVVGGYIVDEIQGVAAQPVLYQFPNPHVISPGHNITAFNGTVNESYTVFFFGYERPLEPEETQP